MVGFRERVFFNLADEYAGTFQMLRIRRSRALFQYLRPPAPCCNYLPSRKERAPPRNTVTYSGTGLSMIRSRGTTRIEILCLLSPLFHLTRVTDIPTPDTGMLPAASGCRLRSVPLTQSLMTALSVGDALFLSSFLSQSLFLSLWSYKQFTTSLR